MVSQKPMAAAVQNEINAYIKSLSSELHNLNKAIFNNPELAYQEHRAHETLCNFLQGLGFQVTRHAYGLQTSFEVISGSGGRLVNFNAEYDALPGIGHACGHNLIATASVTAFIALSHALNKFGIQGRVQLLGTPAEEEGGGKEDLLKAGAFQDVDVSLMMHPMSDALHKDEGALAMAGLGSVARYDMKCIFHGVSAHAGGMPWEGVNALDALVATYNNVSLLRQQIEPEQRIHSAIADAPKITNTIASSTAALYTVRSPTVNGTRKLGERVKRCMEAGALATGCTVEIEDLAVFAELRNNESLGQSFAAHMNSQGMKTIPTPPEIMSGSTDQGNVTHVVPGLHAIVGIPVVDGSMNHTPGFTDAAGTKVAHDRTIVSGKALAMVGWDVITSDALYKRAVDEFEKGKLPRD